MKKGLKNKVASIAMACLMAVSATAGVASATTKRNNIVWGDKWEYTTKISSWSYNSNYYQPLWGGYHWTSVNNNKGGYQRRSANAGCTAYASTSANWFKNGTASIG